LSPEHPLALVIFSLLTPAANAQFTATILNMFTMNDILIIEDDSDCAQLLRLQLEQLLNEEARIQIVSNLQRFQYMLTEGCKPAIVKH